MNFEGVLNVTALDLSAEALIPQSRDEEAKADDSGGPLLGCKPQTLKGDHVSQPVDWDLCAFAGKPIRLRFDLETGRLWSFRFGSR